MRRPDDAALGAGEDSRSSQFVDSNELYVRDVERVAVWQYQGLSVQTVADLLFANRRPKLISGHVGIPFPEYGTVAACSEALTMVSYSGLQPLGVEAGAQSNQQAGRKLVLSHR